MVQTIREHVVIRPGGVIEIRHPELPEGAAAEVVVRVEVPQSKPLALKDLLGKARSGYTSGDDADAFIRAERDAWHQ